ncbi:MAG TPA: hypothetical protein VFZ65_22375 [Planctomycetota bacterium]|nr:hypothetical protein [Planctomycetota bacterium]
MVGQVTTSLADLLLSRLLSIGFVALLLALGLGPFVRTMGDAKVAAGRERPASGVRA